MNRYQPKKLEIPVKAMREHCIECVGSPINEGWQTLIRECPSVECALHDFRMGKNPFHSQNLSEEERKRRAERAKRLHSNDDQTLN